VRDVVLNAAERRAMLRVVLSDVVGHGRRWSCR